MPNNQIAAQLELVNYPNLIKYACKKRYNYIPKPLPLMGGGGAAIVATHIIN